MEKLGSYGKYHAEAIEWGDIVEDMMFNALKKISDLNAQRIYAPVQQNDYIVLNDVVLNHLVSASELFSVVTCLQPEFVKYPNFKKLNAGYKTLVEQRNVLVDVLKNQYNSSDNTKEKLNTLIQKKPVVSEFLEVYLN